MSQKPDHRIQGFTLIEILVALAVFTIVSVIMTTALHNLMRSQAATEKNSERLARVQFALLLFSRDIEQVIDRPVINASNNPAGFIGSSQELTFTHTGLANPFGQLRRPTLQRTRYFFSDGQLIRETWPLPDQTADTKPDQRVMLEQISHLEWSYLDNKGHFQKAWPAAQEKETLPRAVRIVFTLKGWGTLSQLYSIRGQSIDHAS